MEQGVSIAIAILGSIPVIIGIPYALYRWVQDRSYYKLTGGRVYKIRRK
ncbi:MAG: hypothetical protein IJW55_07530 [Clostridia bacterium]|nr:hypothetical protein [Clostridia bacterium]